MPNLHHPIRRALPAAALALLAAAGPAAMAQPAAPAPVAAPAAPTAAGPALNIRQVHDRLEAAGYREIREIELSGNRYEVKARNAQGERVKLEMNATTGAVERSRTRH